MFRFGKRKNVEFARYSKLIITVITLLFTTMCSLRKNIMLIIYEDGARFEIVPCIENAENSPSD